MLSATSSDQMVSLSLSFASPDAAAEFFAAYARGKLVAENPKVVFEKQPTATEISKGVVQKPADKEPTPQTAADTKPTPAPTVAGTTVERATVSKAAVQLAVKNKAKAVEILATFGVAAVRELTDDQLAAAHKALTDALA